MIVVEEWYEWLTNGCHKLDERWVLNWCGDVKRGSVG